MGAANPPKTQQQLQELQQVTTGHCAAQGRQPTHSWQPTRLNGVFSPSILSHETWIVEKRMTSSRRQKHSHHEHEDHEPGLARQVACLHVPASNGIVAVQFAQRLLYIPANADAHCHNDCMRWHAFVLSTQHNCACAFCSGSGCNQNQVYMWGKAGQPETKWTRSTPDKNQTRMLQAGSSEGGMEGV